MRAWFSKDFVLEILLTGLSLNRQVEAENDSCQDQNKFQNSDNRFLQKNWLMQLTLTSLVFSLPIFLSLCLSLSLSVSLCLSLSLSVYLFLFVILSQFLILYTYSVKRFLVSFLVLSLSQTPILPWSILLYHFALLFFMFLSSIFISNEPTPTHIGIPIHIN